MKTYAVIGFPIAHSRSPEIYRELFDKHGIDAGFLKLPVTAEQLPSIRSICKELDGFAVTMPHKKSIMQYLDEITETAAACGAVNIVERRGDTLIGHNTDGDGMADALNDAGFIFEGSHVMILGRGGAAKSAAYALERRGAHVTLLVRSLDASDEFDEEPFPISHLDEKRYCDLFVNASPLGMENAEDFSDFDFLDVLAPRYVLDMVYRNDRSTSLICEAEKRGISFVEGRTMLLKQALRAFRIWTGIEP